MTDNPWKAERRGMCIINKIATGEPLSSWEERQFRIWQDQRRQHIGGGLVVPIHIAAFLLRLGLGMLMVIGVAWLTGPFIGIGSLFVAGLLWFAVSAKWL